jgi:hypothetical protein
MNAVERLHYYNGRRLDAADLRVEQHYHVAMRRLLNRGLFTPGVVNGLEVSKVDTTHVRVAPGLAIDPLGREIVVPDVPDADRTLAVPGQPPTRKLGGYFLMVRYVEEPIPASEDPCAEPATSQAARIRERAELVWTEDFPAHDLCDPLKPSLDCAIVLALVATTTACEIERIEIGVRQYAHPTHVSQVSAIALEGEKDIDKDNPKVLHFQIRGGSPNSVILHLWGGKFSSLHYTEMGSHSHSVSGTLDKVQVDLPQHQHDLSAAVSAKATPQTHGHGTHGHGTGGAASHGHGAHDHNLWVNASNSDLPLALAHTLFPTAPVTWTAVWPGWWFQRAGRPFNKPNAGGAQADDKWVVKSSVDETTLDSVSVEAGGDHTHGLTGNTALNAASKAPEHGHPFTGSISLAGASVGANGLPYQARSGPRYEYVDRMKVELDGVPITTEILARLPSAWQSLGDGFATHQLIDEGTGPLDLIEIANAAGKTIDVGSHTLTFSVASGGGKVLYNLYVE